MKSSGLRVLAVIVFLLAFAGANVGSFLLGRASAEHNSVSWEEASVFYAQIVERRENTLLVEGLPVNDVNHRGQFSFTLARRGNHPGSPVPRRHGGRHLLWGNAGGLPGDAAPGVPDAAFRRRGPNWGRFLSPRLFLRRIGGY